jgi:hypothetical protein
MLILTICCCRSAPAQVRTAPGQETLGVAGRLGDDNTFTKRLTLLSHTAIQLTFYPGELAGPPGAPPIGPMQVTASPTPVTLAADTAAFVDLKVSGIKVAGVYDGKIQFLKAGGGLDPVLTIDMHVAATPSPLLALRKADEKIKLMAVNCMGLDCWLARRLVPAAFIASYHLDLDDNAIGPFDAQIGLSGQGELYHAPLAPMLRLEADAQPTPMRASVTVPAGPIYTLPIANPGGPDAPRIAPDRYVGTLQLNPPAPDPALKVPLEVAVRNGPGWPVFVLFLGLLLGRLLKYMQDKGGPQSDLLLQYYHLEARIYAQPADWQTLRAQLEAVKTRILDMELDRAKTDLAAVQKQFEVLGRLRGFEALLVAHYQGDPAAQPILALIRQARWSIELGEDASPIVSKIDTAMQALSPPALAQAASEFQMAMASASSAQRAAAASQQSPAIPPNPNLVVRILYALTGISGGFRAELTLWVLRPLLFCLLLAALLVVGMKQLYVNNAIFGADWVSDYFGLFIWATGSDQASRTLSSLKS